jgi:hypothetical protein
MYTGNRIPGVPVKVHEVCVGETAVVQNATGDIFSVKREPEGFRVLRNNEATELLMKSSEFEGAKIRVIDSTIRGELRRGDWSFPAALLAFFGPR